MRQLASARFEGALLAAQAAMLARILWQPGYPLLPQALLMVHHCAELRRWNRVRLSPC